jgi:hypothetical protein
LEDKGEIWESAAKQYMLWARFKLTCPSPWSGVGRIYGTITENGVSTTYSGEDCGRGQKVCSAKVYRWDKNGTQKYWLSLDYPDVWVSDYVREGAMTTITCYNGITCSSATIWYT